MRSSRRYIPGTAVLETRFETRGGIATLTDFMPVAEDDGRVDVVRIVRGVKGRVDFDMELILRFNNGQAVPWVRKRDYGLSAVCGPDAVELHTAMPLKSQDFSTRASFTVGEGETVPFSLSYHASHRPPHFVPDRAESQERTVAWWQRWCERCTFATGEASWRDAVLRSLITLKLLTYGPTGGIVAAPTTSLPESPGGARNWDYR